jgi:hypothetical protein
MPIGILVLGFTERGGGVGRFADTDESRAQEAFVVDISWLKHTRDRARPVAVVYELKTRFVPVRVERLTDRIQPAQTMLGERIKQSPMRCLYPLKQTAESTIRALLRRHACDRAFQVVCRWQQVAGELRRGILHRLLTTPLGLPANILLVSQTAQQAILGRRQFRSDFSNILLRHGARRGRLSLIGSSPLGSVVGLTHGPVSVPALAPNAY